MKSKKIAKIVIIIILLILLIPIPFKLKDGGTVEWKSLTYSISKVNSIYSIDDIRMGYKKGVIIKIFNITVFNNSKYDIEKEFVIVDSSKNNENFTCASALEEIYKDDEYIYYLPCQKSQYIKVIYAPNEYQEGLKSSLEDGTIKINGKDITIEGTSSIEAKAVSTKIIGTAQTELGGGLVTKVTGSVIHILGSFVTEIKAALIKINS